MSGAATVPPLATIGYEAAAQAQVIGGLRAAGVELLIDVRAIAASRRAACLLCYEADPGCRHRLIVADMIAARTGAPVAHLHPNLDSPPPLG